MSPVPALMWQPNTSVAVPDTLSDPAVIISKALQLRPREKSQLEQNFEQGNFELAATFVWVKTISLLKRLLSSLGPSFIAEILQRSDIDEFSDINEAISDGEAISLARNLGILTSLQTTRLLQSQAIVNHFAGGADEEFDTDLDACMTQEEAISCLRVCVQGVLAHEKISAAQDFQAFRFKLETETLSSSSPEIVKLKSSPYFFVRTAISMLLNLIRVGKGAQLEHAARNAQLIVPEFWNALKAPERWQIGQTYASEYSEGRKESVKGLHAVLLAVNGFDYVPENLRSNTFAKIASQVISAHQGMNNFYNEPVPMRELSNLGTSIPSPALASCITATLCVKLGNAYGISRDAQRYADRLINGISEDRWIFYIDGRLFQDRIILTKLLQSEPRDRWKDLFSNALLDPDKLQSSDSRKLMKATILKQDDRIRSIAKTMLENL